LAFASSAAIDSAAALEMCQLAEKIRFESVWGGEHVIIPTKIDSAYPYTADGKIPVVPDQPIPAPLIWLAYVAACGV
jgi:alkanesulfonate monooxygenase SsuD/methylene tetrahydromethanopterin reductase-like flavin-dependent oxidoreductase (luciferase family)